MTRIDLAIIGCGGYALTHAQEILKYVPEFRVVGLADADIERARKMGREFFAKDEPQVFADYAEMLGSVKPEAVIVSTPHALHYRHCEDALDAGAHVLVDKPMVIRSEDGRALVRRAAGTGKALMVAVQGMYTSTFAYCRQMIKEGTLGQIQVATGTMAADWMRGTMGLWRQNPAISGGGQLHDGTAHVLAILMALIGSPVRDVFCQMANLGTTVDINAVATIRFANGVLATITSGGNCEVWDSRVMIQSERAFLEINPYTGKLALRVGDMSSPIISEPPGDWKIPTVAPVRNFADVIMGRAESRCDGEGGVALAMVLEALYASAKSGVVTAVRAVS